MKIAVDVSIQETPYITGVERVQRSLLTALAKLDRRNEYLLISKRTADLRLDLPRNFTQVVAVKEGSPYLWRERVVPGLLSRAGIDIFHSPVSATPILGKARKIATLHELPWMERDAGTSQGDVVRRGHRVWLFLNVRYASRIVAVSNRTRENILTLYPEAEDRIQVIYHGVDDRFQTLKVLPERGPFLARFGIPDRPFLFFVGTLRRKKNLRTLLDVFAELPEPERSTYSLVMAGIRNPAWPEFEDWVRAEKLRGRVFLPGFVSDPDLVTFYNMATAVVYPSLFEGFGLPPLEAMACGAPVITSSGGAIPEVVGKAALVFPPDRPDMLKDAILQVLRSPGLAALLRKKGRRHARKFTWEKSAEQYLQLYEELA
ncbi:MAG: glycosyltransferase family 1 protein [Planctomycetota bacterium]